MSETTSDDNWGGGYRQGQLNVMPTTETKTLPAFQYTYKLLKMLRRQKNQQPTAPGNCPVDPFIISVSPADHDSGSQFEAVLLLSGLFMAILGIYFTYSTAFI